MERRRECAREDRRECAGEERRECAGDISDPKSKKSFTSLARNK